MFTARMCIGGVLRAVALGGALLLAACAGTKVDNLVSTAPAPATLAAPPHSIAVVVTAPRGASRDVARTQAALAKQLSQMLASRDFTAVPAGEGLHREPHGDLGEDAPRRNGAAIPLRRG